MALPPSNWIDICRESRDIFTRSYVCGYLRLQPIDSRLWIQKWECFKAIDICSTWLQLVELGRWEKASCFKGTQHRLEIIVELQMEVVVQRLHTSIRIVNELLLMCSISLCFCLNNSNNIWVMLVRHRGIEHTKLLVGKKDLVHHHLPACTWLWQTLPLHRLWSLFQFSAFWFSLDHRGLVEAWWRLLEGDHHFSRTSQCHRRLWISDEWPQTDSTIEWQSMKVQVVQFESSTTSGISGFVRANQFRLCRSREVLVYSFAPLHGRGYGRSSPHQAAGCTQLW